MRKKILGKNKEKRTQKLFITAKMRLLPITPNQLILKVLSAKHANVTIIYQRGTGHIKKGKNKKHEKFFLINFLKNEGKFPLLRNDRRPLPPPSPVGREPEGERLSYYCRKKKAGTMLSPSHSRKI